MEKNMYEDMRKETWLWRMRDSFLENLMFELWSEEWVGNNKVKTGDAGGNNSRQKQNMCKITRGGRTVASCGAGRTSYLWFFFGSQLKPTRALYVNLIRSLTCSKLSYYSLLPRTSPPHHIWAHCYATNGLQGASNTDPSILGPSILLHLLQSATQNQNDTNFLCALMRKNWEALKKIKLKYLA